MNNKDMVSAMAERLPRGLFEVFCAVRDLPDTAPVTAARIGAQLDRTPEAVILSLKRLEKMGLVCRDAARPPAFSVADLSADTGGHTRPVPVYQHKRGCHRARVGTDGLTEKQREMLAVIRAVTAEPGRADGFPVQILSARAGLSDGVVIGRLEGLVKKGLIRVWVKPKSQARPRRMVALIPHKAAVTAQDCAQNFQTPRGPGACGYAPLKSVAVERAIYGAARYEDVPRSQRIADRINTPVPARTPQFSLTQWSGA